ncbi:insulinase family protein [bacterium]|nr:insulinase family protein [bacterium]
MSKIKFRLKKTKGAKIISIELNHLHSLALNINFWVGSFLENKKEAGISHFLEHMVFKGSKKHPNEQAIGAAVEKYGGIINAFTSAERTIFWLVSPKIYTEKTLPVLFDVVFNPLAIKKREEIEKEKQVILEERKMYKDRPDSYVDELADKNLNTNHPISQPTIGYQKTIKSIDKKKLTNWWQNNYLPQNCVITLSGPGTHKFAEKVEKLIPNKKPLERKRSIPTYVSPQKPRLAVHYKKIKQTNLVWLFERVKPANLKENIAIQLLAKILGQGLNSILFSEIRTKLGLSYDISAHSFDFKSFQLLSVSGGFAPEKTKKAIQKMGKIFQKLKTSGIDEQKLREAKKGNLGELETSLDNPQTIAHFALEGIRLFNRPLSIEEIKRTTQAITKKDMDRVLRELIKPQNTALTLLGPLKEKEGLLELIQKIK